ncbi:hypothetical protein ANN_22693 [Periplaneta americana]|uniref:Uncharacterized protein n=1 Tax=Periplaneta americana TaxID=6978 RepID=A0ABQ8S9S2_PERAM|nr:hypothetical protein ANN_22693 [Periplaneta americana]
MLSWVCQLLCCPVDSKPMPSWRSHLEVGEVYVPAIPTSYAEFQVQLVFVYVHNNRDSGAALAVECTLKQYASSSGRVKVVSLFLSEPRAVKMCAAIASPARCEISHTLLYKVITEDLGYRKVSSRWVPKLLSEEQKAQLMGAALCFLERYEREGDAFLDQIMTGDET